MTNNRLTYGPVGCSPEIVIGDLQIELTKPEENWVRKVCRNDPTYLEEVKIFMDIMKKVDQSQYQFLIDNGLDYRDICDGDYSISDFEDDEDRGWMVSDLIAIMQNANNKLGVRLFDIND